MSRNSIGAVLVVALGALLTAAAEPPPQQPDSSAQLRTIEGQVDSMVDLDARSKICAIPTGRCTMPVAHAIDEPCSCWTTVDGQRVKVAGRVVP